MKKKIISKNFLRKKLNSEKSLLNKQIILEIKEQITNLVKSQNLINLRTPSFLNVKLNLDDKNNLVSLNSKIKNVDLIENIFILKFNKDEVYLKIKFLGKIEKLTNQLKNENISLKLINDEWFIRKFIIMDQLTLNFHFLKNIMNKIFLFLVIIFQLLN